MRVFARARALAHVCLRFVCVLTCCGWWRVTAMCACVSGCVCIMGCMCVLQCNPKASTPEPHTIKLTNKGFDPQLFNPKLKLVYP